MRKAAALIILSVAAIPAAASAGERAVQEPLTAGRIACVLSKGGNSLALISVAGTKVRRLVRGGRITDPAWSPDRRRVAFSWAHAGRPAQLYVVRVADGRMRRLTRGRQSAIQPDWSPDGKRIVFVRIGGGPTHLFTLDLHSGKVRRLVAGQRSDGAPTYSRRGRLAFTRLLASPSGDEEPVFNQEIYVANRDGSKPVRLTRGKGSDVDPAWSPDGRWIAYSAGVGVRARIWIMRADGSAKRAITPGPLDTEPTWAPDGRRIAFTHRTAGNASIYVVTLAARRPFSVTKGLGPATSADWG